MNVPIGAPWRRSAFRFRRPLAAALAGLAVLLTISTLTSTPAPAPTASVRDWSSPGEVTVPVPLAVRSVADILDPGDIVDLVSVSEDGRAQVVASRVRVVEQPGSGGGGFTPAEALLLVSVPAGDALALAAATARGGITVLIHGSTPTTALDSQA